MVLMSIPVASAFIAAGVVVLQFVLPNVLALLMTGRVSRKSTHSAVTWSVVSRYLLSSDWPLILGSDAVASKAVTPEVRILTWVRPLSLLLIAIAAAVTPLGLYDALELSDDAEYTPFMYAHGDDVFGVGTTPRDMHGPSRLCGNYILCPGSKDMGNTLFPINPDFSNRTGPIKMPEIPQTLLDLYQSGRPATGNGAVSSFDIAWRQFTLATQSDLLYNATRPLSHYERLDSIIMDDKFAIVEGLIVDTENGGVGFRNHSVPQNAQNSQNAAEWYEDILFMEPDAVCINTNISAAFERPINASAYGTDRMYYILDRGGFANLATESPYLEAQNEQSFPFPKGQTEPNLFTRAYYAAWGFANHTMVDKNLTSPKGANRTISSSVGKRIGNKIPAGVTLSSDQTISKTINFVTSFGETNSGIAPELEVQEYCRNPIDGGFADIDNIAVEIGGIVLPTREYEDIWNQVGPLNATFERPYYICAAATKMSIKTVRLRYNSTFDGDRLAGLHVVSTEPKKYKTDGDMPIWGVETPKPPVPFIGRTVSDWYFDPIWGFISVDNTATSNLTYRTSESFYIPASYKSSWDFGDMNGLDNLPATIAGPAIWREALDEYSPTSGLYSGDADLAQRNL